MVQTEYNNKPLLDSKTKWMSQFVKAHDAPKYLYTENVKLEQRYIGSHLTAVALLAKRLQMDHVYVHVTNQIRFRGPQMLESTMSDGSSVWCVSIPPYVDPLIYFTSDYHPWKCYGKETRYTRTVVVSSTPDINCIKLLNAYGDTAKEYFYSDRFIGTELLPSANFQQLAFQPNAFNTPLLVLSNKLAQRSDLCLMQIIHSNYYGTEPLNAVSTGDFARILYAPKPELAQPVFNLALLEQLIQQKIITETIVIVNAFNGQGSARLKVEPWAFVNIARDLQPIMEYRRILDEPLLEQIVPGYLYRLGTDLVIPDEKIVLINHKMVEDIDALLKVALSPKDIKSEYSSGPASILIQGIRFWRVALKNVEHYPAHIAPLAMNLLLQSNAVVQDRYDGEEKLYTNRTFKTLHRFSEACKCKRKVAQL